ncbi:glycosyl hydrolase [Goekera deserti]|uniref:GH26 domain-containing protein n=1 Tax=Goekera deserti TaxID=2497753 RepID=A0A7K3WAS3_9ACTN|nr:glycosyl hydrolase [Goekera deserti]NDI49192.1 hypothetical protein [Goekera deserti]NEL52930.1 hypothetical protein [Goekera deserti]
MPASTTTTRSVLLVAGALLASTGVVTPAPAARADADTSVGWLSGASGAGVVDGDLAAWRGSPLEIAGTWADDNRSMTGLWALRPGGALDSWAGPVDIAIGALGPGETWQQAATGAYDARWRESLTNLRTLWGERTSTLYVRLAHEMNGTWYPWSVRDGDVAAFQEAWKRFRAMQQEIVPAAQLVFSVNRESANGIDWRTTFPGAEYVDVLGTNAYNQFPYVASDADWDAYLNGTDATGAPRGLQQHLDFARSVGLPLAVSEWSGNADFGDSPAFVDNLHRWFAANAGSGPGQVLYEVQFNVPTDNRKWLLDADSRMPAAADRYRELW